MTELVRPKRILELGIWSILYEPIVLGVKDIDLRQFDSRFARLQPGDVLIFKHHRNSTPVELTDKRTYLNIGQAIVNEEWSRIAPGLPLDDMLRHIPRLFPGMQHNPKVVALEFVLL